MGVRRWGPLLFAVVFGVLQIGALELSPPRYRTPISTAFLLVAMAGLIGVVVYRRHVAKSRDRHTIPAHRVAAAARKATTRMRAPSADQTPDATMRAAVVLARSGFSAARLADTFGLPLALTEMIVQQEHAGNHRSTSDDGPAAD
jgi:hypothetical protein